jgi:hypothetical protein
VLTVSDGTLTDTDSFTWTVTEPSAVTTYASDNFSRTSTNSWGSAQIGGNYTVQNTVGAYSVNGGTGAMGLGAAGANRSAILGSVSAVDVDMTFKVTRDKAPAGGAQFIYGIIRSNSNASNAYRAKLRLFNNQVFVHGSVVVNNAESPIGSEVLVPGLGTAAGSTIWLRAQVFGANPTTIRVRAWADGSPEPTTWQYSQTNSNAAVQGAGAVGLRSYVSGSTTNAPLVFRYDDFLVTSIAGQ